MTNETRQPKRPTTLKFAAIPTLSVPLFGDNLGVKQPNEYRYPSQKRRSGIMAGKMVDEFEMT